MESVLVATPREFESRILRRTDRRKQLSQPGASGWLFAAQSQFSSHCRLTKRVRFVRARRPAQRRRLASAIRVGQPEEVMHVGHIAPEVPAASAHSGTHRARPVSARFEPVSQLKDVKRRFLAYSFPPRSPDPHHLAVLARPGFVRAAPALPAATRIRLPSATGTCCDRPQAKVFHLHSSHSASRRKLDARHALGCFGRSRPDDGSIMLKRPMRTEVVGELAAVALQ